MQWQSCVLMLKQDLVLTLQLKDYSLQLCFLEHGSFLDPACTGFLNIPDPTGKHSYCSRPNRRLQWNLCLLPSHGWKHAISLWSTDNTNSGENTTQNICPWIHAYICINSLCEHNHWHNTFSSLLTQQLRVNHPISEIHFFPTCWFIVFTHWLD